MTSCNSPMVLLNKQQMDQKMASYANFKEEWMDGCSKPMTVGFSINLEENIWVFYT